MMDEPLEPLSAAALTLVLAERARPDDAGLPVEAVLARVSSTVGLATRAALWTKVVIGAVSAVVGAGLGGGGVYWRMTQQAAPPAPVASAAAASAPDP